MKLTCWISCRWAILRVRRKFSWWCSVCVSVSSTKIQNDCAPPWMPSLHSVPEPSHWRQYLRRCCGSCPGRALGKGRLDAQLHPEDLPGDGLA